MLTEYIGGSYAWERDKEELLARVRTMKSSLPDWYLTELRACAEEVGVKEDILLYAQCEGDIQSLGGCTSFVAFGPATHGGTVEMGRNFDYWGLESTRECAVVLAVVPSPEDGHAFVSIGWTGILGGWTFINEKGVFVSNNLGGGWATDPKGIPTLVMERIIAQKAASVDEAVALVRGSPRMRGQVLIVGQAGDADKGVPPHAVELSYDAQMVTVTPAKDGLIFNSSIGADEDAVRKLLRRRFHRPTSPIHSAGNSITLHSVAIRPTEHKLWVAHGPPSHAHKSKYVSYDLRRLFRR
ncbi:MAG: hypothetical protein HON70_19530 [Lentisphaerae bacterium]|nr:hypothetical protein [Lentisphaerota bacterium]